MIKVLEEKPVRVAIINCPNCDSKLQYANVDLLRRWDMSPNHLYNNISDYYFKCPVCGCEVYASWIGREGEKV